MGEVTIALRAPVAAKTIERWVETQVARLRDAAWPSRVRLGGLSRAWRAQDADWMIEVDLRDRAVPVEEDLVLGSVLMELALLGLRPHLSVGSGQEASSPSVLSGATKQHPVRPAK